MQELLPAQLIPMTNEQRDALAKKAVADTEGTDAPLTYSQALAAVDAAAQREDKAKVFKNDKYQVLVTPCGGAQGDGEVYVFVWLSIKRLDREPVHDWRDLQEIKNQLVGPECEAFEIYPAESRLVDTANQYHLWACTSPKFRVPFGFNEGRRATYDIDPATGAKQRPMTDE